MTDASKKKKGHFSRLSSVRFAILWTLTTGIAWGSVIGLGFLLENILWVSWYSLPEWLYFLGGGVLIGAIAGTGQQWLMHRRFGERVRGWRLTTVAGWGIASLFFYWYGFGTGIMDDISRMVSSDMLVMLIGMSGLFVPLAAVQMIFLQKHVQRAWLWIASAVASSALFAIPFMHDMFTGNWQTVIGFGVAGLLQGSVMGFVMLWLWQMGTRSRDALHNIDTGQKSLANKSHQRLQDSTRAASTGPLEIPANTRHDAL
jgi:hypothetical protein